MGDVARRLGKPLLPWQQHVADVGLELNPDGSFVYSEVDMTVPRQSGKTVLTQAKTVHRLVKMARTYGPQRSMYTAQRRADARKKLEQDFAENLRRAPRRAFPEVTALRGRPRRPTEWKLNLNNGQESIKFGTGSYWQIDAPTSEAGHGDTLDDGTIDEAFAHETDDVEGAMEPAMLTRRDAQLWVLSTAGDEHSFYLYRKILAGRAAIEEGAPSSVAYFEWSAPEDADPGDPRTWRACSPALGYTISEAKIARLWQKAQRGGQESIDTFCRAYLNQWPHPPNLEDAAVWVISEADWQDTCDDESALSGAPAFALAVAEDRSWSAFAAAGASSLDEDLTHGEVFDYREGTAWVGDRAAGLIGRHGGQLAIVAGSPAAALEKDLKRAGLRLSDPPRADDEIVVVPQKEYAAACSQLYDAVTDGKTFRHRDQPVLEVALRSAVRREMGDGLWVWARRRSNVDVSPLEALTVAAGRHDPDADLDLADQVF